MTVFEAIILGAVQGVSEFLPVSSSGHLVLLQHIFGISGPVLLFDTMVHIGTLAAVFVVFWRDIWGILRRPLQPLTAFLVLGTVPAVVAALVLKDSIEAAFESAEYLGFAFLFTSLALLVSDRLSRRSGAARPGGSMSWLDAVLIGICQAVAIVPGVSRSGLTLSGALSLRLDREYAARFSFLLSIPAILGALVLQLRELFFAAGGAGSAGPPIAPGAAPMVLGTITAAVVGFFSVRLMLGIVRRFSLWGFAVYTAALGALVLADKYLTKVFF